MKSMRLFVRNGVCRYREPALLQPTILFLEDILNSDGRYAKRKSRARGNGNLNEVCVPKLSEARQISLVESYALLILLLFTQLASAPLSREKQSSFRADYKPPSEAIRIF